MIDDVRVVPEDAAGEAVVPQELPEVLDRIELRGLGRQRQEGDVGRRLEGLGGVPPGLVEQQDRVMAGLDPGADLGQMGISLPGCRNRA